jgi:F0F1-type ATP synthase membrane subunit c/vacuolar-type H+-ATPase subunit K
MTMINGDLLTGLGAVSALLLSAIGSAMATGPAGMVALSCRYERPSSTSSSSSSMIHRYVVAFLPTIIANVLVVYGFIIAGILVCKLRSKTNVHDSSSISEAEGYQNLTAGLLVGFATMVSGSGMSYFLSSVLWMFRNMNNAMKSAATTDVDDDDNNKNNETTLISAATTASAADETLLLQQPLLLALNRKNMKHNMMMMMMMIHDDPNNLVTLPLLMVLVFLEAIGLYGLILGLMVLP